MTYTRIHLGLGTLALVAALAGFVRSAPEKQPAAQAFTAEQIAFYEKQVLPILKESCLKCHTGKKPRGKLWLDSRAGILKGARTDSQEVNHVAI